MDLLERTFQNKKELYNLALEYFYNISPEDAFPQYVLCGGNTSYV